MSITVIFILVMLCVLLLVVVIAMVFNLRKFVGASDSTASLDALQKLVHQNDSESRLAAERASSLERTVERVQEEISTLRDQTVQQLTSSRDTVDAKLGEVRSIVDEKLGAQFKAQQDALSSQQSALLAQLGESNKRLNEVRDTLDTQLKAQRADSSQHLERMRATVDERLGAQFKAQQDALSSQQSALFAQLGESNKRLNEVRDTLDTQLKSLQADNNEQLERMRATVDEKLQKTLNERITQSFNLVNESLDKVGRGLGEMQNLAQDVGGLKKMLSNVKSRGVVGEIQLAAILKEILSPTQYEENVATVPGSDNRVEFAVKMPGENGETVYLPIDSKFPGDAYEHLRDAVDGGDSAAVETAWKALETRLKQEAKDIHDKYVEPPATTSFGILFLPFEGLYAEVVNRPGLLEEIQRKFRVNIAGPSTMAALLNSLQMGFQTVAIQKRAGEIQTVLAAVKTEFGTYQEMLLKAQKQLGTASKTVDLLVGRRSRAMKRKLQSITELDDPSEAERILGIEPELSEGTNDIQIINTDEQE